MCAGNDCRVALQLGEIEAQQVVERALLVVDFDLAAIAGDARTRVLLLSGLSCHSSSDAHVHVQHISDDRRLGAKAW